MHLLFLFNFFIFLNVYNIIFIVLTINPRFETRSEQERVVVVWTREGLLHWCRDPDGSEV